MTEPRTAHGPHAAAAAVFPGGSEMAARCRAFDWAATPLGPVDAWPPHLRVAAALVLAGGLPMALHYGPEAIQLYNDACAPSLGPQHPAALGRPLFASFPETRDAVAALHARVWRGETVTLGDQAFPMWRDGRLEEVVWTFCYAPLRDEQGAVAGVLVTGLDITARTAAETARARLLVESETARAAADLERRRLATVLEQLPVGVTLAEAPSGRLLLSNAAVRRIWGLDTPSAAIDDYSTDYVGYHTTPDARAGQPVASDEWPLARALTRGEVVTDEVIEIRHPDGTRRMVSISAAPVRDAEARVVGGVVTSLDVTERARLLAESERARAAAEAASAQLVDQALELELTNQQLQEQAVELEMQAEALRATADALADRTREAERSAQRDAFLAEASRLLASSLDPAITLGHVAGLAVPALADWCGIDLVDTATGAIEPVAVAHVDPSRVAWARQVRRDYLAHPDATTGVPAVLRTGQAEFYPEVTDAMLVATARDAAHLALMREVGITSVIVAPLAARGRTLGTLSLVAASPGRRFTPEDLALAEEIGRRAGVALDHARAHAAEQAAREQAEESERRFRATADAAPVLIWTAGTDTLCDWFNQPWLAYCGRPMEAVLGNGWAEDVHPDDYDRCLATYLGAFDGRTTFSMEYRLRRHDGAYRWLLDNAVPRFAADGTFVGYIGTCVDVTEQREAREAAEAAARRVAYLAEASARLAGSLDVEATLRTVAELAVPTLADWSFVEVLERGRVRPMAVAHAEPEMVRLAHALLDRYPIDLEAPYGTGKVLRTGEPELTPDIPDAVLAAVARDEAHLAALRQLGFRSSLTVPLVDPVDARPVAALSLVSAESGRRYDAADLAMAEEVARRGSVALAGARLYAVGQAALRRARALQQVSDALAGALTAGEVAEVVVRHGRAAVEAVAGSFLVLSADGGAFELLASEGYDDASVRAFARFPVTPGRPLSDAVLGGTPVYVPSLDDAQVRYPEMTPVLRATGFEALAALPVRVGPGAAAALSFSFLEPRAFDQEEGAFLETLAAQAGQALERARLVQAERAARAAAEEANAAKTQFLSTMSHELRTPLNAIGGYADLLAMGVRGPVTEAQGQDLERLRRANQHLTGLVTDVLSFARLEAGQVEYHLAETELGPVVADVEALVGPQLAARGLTFDHDGCAPDTPDRPHAVRADAEKVRQILLNLLTNAAKFTDPGGRIALACTTDAETATVRLRVIDTGRGVPADQLERIFQPFVQVDRHRTAGSQQGVGLGLAISRDLARGMGGDLTAESTPGVGSTFTLTLPAA